MYSFLFLAAMVFYFISAVFFVIFVVNKNSFLSKAAPFLAVCGFSAQTLSLALRTLMSGVPPLSNLYESMVIFSWMTVLVFLLIKRLFKINIAGAFILPLVFLITGYASLLDDAVAPLMPALRSYWLVIHVSSCFLGYACFACAFSLGLMYLLQERQVKLKKIGRLFDRLPALHTLDRVNYNMVLFGFVFLTVGIMTGSVWAQQAWGRWWSWDPKETWSLITWLIYAAYLHARLSSGWRGRKTAILSIGGFVSVLFTYLGVSFLLPGRHAYL
ncbi:MAG: c-type cytochrome biogenesis protein CcsB [Candidatus Omnitrophica bacterium]|nr:c-type cytochrome biogenesis protein CcsB [Candidatus Omnitrophota bacterium]MBU4479278.1 c-type cytochrome biogenesis protein CcsB [Candidatus Omnitrophota bacterium]MCG2703259.1 c-type cytochrome biogenesis protein CcsB [Candidatus Omnitrophota bacterium]